MCRQTRRDTLDFGRREDNAAWRPNSKAESRGYYLTVTQLPQIQLNSIGQTEVKGI
jgi:hypothetical protein